MLRSDQLNIVIGAGPVGLAAALELLKSDSKLRKVVVFTDRDEYTRRQVLKIENEDIGYVTELASRSDVINLYQTKKIVRDYDSLRDHPVVSLQTKNLEELLYRELQEYVKLGRVEIINTKQNNQSIAKIDKNRHVVTLTNGRKIPFDIIFAADGAKRVTAASLHDSEDFPIEYYPAQTDPLCAEHAVINFKLPETMPKTSLREDIITMDRVPARISDEMMERLRNLGWTHESPPEVRIFQNGDVFYVAGECPKQAQKTPEKRERWLREVLRTYLPQKEIDQLTVHVDRAGKPENYPLNIELDEANKPIFHFPKSLTDPEHHSAYLVLLGDALRTTNYHTGSGALTGLREVKALRGFLQSKQTRQDWREFEIILNLLRDQNRDRVEGYNAMRLAREAGERIRSANQGIRKKHGSDRTPSPENNNVTEAFKTLGIDPNPYYVCDRENALMRFYTELGGHPELLRRLNGPGPEHDAEDMIVDHLRGCKLQKQARTQCDFSTRIHDDADALLPTFFPQEESESARGEWINMAYKEAESRHGNGARLLVSTYHFYKFRLAKQSGNLVAADVQYCAFYINNEGVCTLSLPGFVEHLHQQAKLRFGLKLETPCWGRARRNIDETALRDIDDKEFRVFDNVGQIDLGDLVMRRNLGDVSYSIKIMGRTDVNIKVPSEKLDEALRFLHDTFCVNPELSADAFVAYMQSKIQKRVDESARVKAERERLEEIKRNRRDDRTRGTYEGADFRGADFSNRNFARDFGFFGRGAQGGQRGTDADVSPRPSMSLSL